LARDELSEPAIDERRLRIHTLDGYDLGAMLYAARTDAAPQRAVVLHGGAGIPALHYRRFARFLARAGMPVLTYDYRGVGMSRPPALRGFRSVIEDWAEFDCSAAIGWMRGHLARATLIGIAHSLGALIFGGAHNAAAQGRLVLIGAHTGFYGDYLPVYRWPMAVLWHGLMPALARVIGYFPGRRLGLGDDLPAGIALQWASRRSSDLRAVGTGPGADRTRRLLDRCAMLERSALVIRMSDDAFATAAGERRCLAYYPRLTREHVVYTPADAGTRKIGHFGYFSRRAGPALWPQLIARLEDPEGS
jgi:predicted alpha/beta hydrolase